ncbi:hypothetical protein GLYMA_02G149850v4 [Glycine max]|nr:hypothetical protein GLYMA_02G149850v4 [Glycine max]KAG4402230.1 hypothetical protein GLYMA_02G149850v4 [Glycine max]KAH1060431.1 hypothetical protein GYH30_004074 [Glycine max]KAH1060432.1 hypothetical protein GYH30_004074 [Glycine max]
MVKVKPKKCEQPMASLIMGMRSYSSKTIGIQLQGSKHAPNDQTFENSDILTHLILSSHIMHHF